MKNAATISRLRSKLHRAKALLADHAERNMLTPRSQNMVLLKQRQRMLNHIAHLRNLLEHHNAL